MTKAAVSLALMLQVLRPSSARAELLRVEVKIVHRDCESCEATVRTGGQKFEGISSIAVSGQDGIVLFELRDGNVVTIRGLLGLIKTSGFVSKEATVTARGTLVGDLFTVRFSDESVRVNGRLAKLARERWTLVVPVTNQFPQ